MSLVSSMSIAQQALAVNQAAITTVSNNIANVDNKNYSKLRVNLTDIVSFTKLTDSAIMQANTLSGVQLSSITRFSDDYLENYCRTENSSYSYLNQYSTVASNVQDLMNELKDTGLSNALSNFYDAASALNDDPTNVTLRQNYVSSAQNVASVFNNVYENLNSYKNSLIGDYTIINDVNSSDIGTKVNEVNDILDQLAQVNSSIVKTNSTDTSSNSLLDNRDALLSKLSDYIPITTTINENGTASVSLGNHDLVNGSIAVGYLGAASGTAAEPAIINIVDKAGTILSGDINSSITSGSIGALLDFCGTSSTDFTISSVVNNLNTLASNFASALNTIQTGDPEGDGTTAMCLTNNYSHLAVSTTPFFLNNETGTTAGITAKNISVNTSVSNNLYLIAAARVTNITDTTATGNNSNMKLISESRNNTYGTLNNQTFEGYLASLVSGIGSQVKNIDDSLTTQSTVLDQVNSKLQSETGVNLDEELGDLMKYQQAYEASARVFKVCSDLLTDLIHLGE